MTQALQDLGMIVEEVLNVAGITDRIKNVWVEPLSDSGWSGVDLTYHGYVISFTMWTDDPPRFVEDLGLRNNVITLTWWGSNGVRYSMDFDLRQPDSIDKLCINFKDVIKEYDKRRA